MVKEIDLNHICKIEGHASLTLKIEKHKVVLCQLEAAEGARFFEALVIGKGVEDVQEIVSRICGICSSAHTVAAIQALENALGMKASKQQQIIRELLMIGERIRSHATHLYFLALPDYFGFSSALTMQGKHNHHVQEAIELIQLGNSIVELFGGREIHPFLHIKEQAPSDLPFKEIQRKLEASKKTAYKTIALFSSLKYPKIERDVDYLCLGDKEYSAISGPIVSHSKKINVLNYSKHLQENVKEYATSKFVLKDGEPYMVGALARLNNGHAHLDSETKQFLKGFEFPIKNPYFNNFAQAIELLHAINSALDLIKEVRQESSSFDFQIKAGRGVAAVEAPRGTLFHEYVINKEGVISTCNIIPPTTQNLAMIELDIKQLVNQLLEKNTSKTAIVRELEKLIRAYDPCFSCATHFLRVKWL